MSCQASCLGECSGLLASVWCCSEFLRAGLLFCQCVQTSTSVCSEVLPSMLMTLLKVILQVQRCHMGLSSAVLMWIIRFLNLFLVELFLSSGQVLLDYSE